MRTPSLLVALVAAAALAGCASGVVRDGPAAQAPARTPVSQVTLTLSPAAQKLAAENPDFSQSELLATVRRHLDAKGLLGKDASAPKAEILLTEFRARSTASAVLFGALAGNDNVTGDVILRDASGRQVKKFTVNASYALGGFAGGQGSRLGWLYEKFAEHTVAELSGEAKR